MGHLGHFQAGGDEDLCRVSGASATGWLKEEEEASGRSPPGSIAAGPGRSGPPSANGLVLDVEPGAINRQQHTPWSHQPGLERSSPAPSSCPAPGGHPLPAPRFHLPHQF